MENFESLCIECQFVCLSVCQSVCLLCLALLSESYCKVRKSLENKQYWNWEINVRYWEREFETNPEAVANTFTQPYQLYMLKTFRSVYPYRNVLNLLNYIYGRKGETVIMHVTHLLTLPSGSDWALSSSLSRGFGWISLWRKTFGFQLLSHQRECPMSIIIQFSQLNKHSIKSSKLDNKIVFRNVTDSDLIKHWLLPWRMLQEVSPK
jgi:hypothetical protein